MNYAWAYDAHAIWLLCHDTAIWLRIQLGLLRDTRGRVYFLCASQLRTDCRRD